MDATNTLLVTRKAAGAQANREELAERIERAIREDRSMEVLKGLRPNCLSSPPREPLHAVCVPVFCVIAQGSKEVVVGDQRYVYDSANYLLVTAVLPVVGKCAKPRRRAHT